MKKIQLTDTQKEKLFQIPLFRDLPLNIKESLLEKLDFVIYAADKKEIVVTQGTPCNKLYVLLEGKLRTDIIDGLGNEVMIEYIIAPRTFATPHLFNPNNTLPATFTALEDSVILMATKDSTFKVISQDPQVLHNFLCIAGNCNICTVSRLKPLSRKTVRERFIVYLFEHKKKDSLIVEITHTQSQLAEYLNVSRPALSKEINKIIKEGLITMEGKRVEILNKAALEKFSRKLFIAVVDKFCFSAQNPRNKFTETNGTFAEFIDEYVKGVQRTMDMLSNLIGPGSDKVVQGKFSYHAQYFHFLFQLLQYDPNAKEKLHNLIVGDYAYWRTAIQRAINTGELRKDVDVEDAVVMFRQVYMGLSFEMSFLGGLDTERLAKHLRAVYSLLKC